MRINLVAVDAEVLEAFSDLKTRTPRMIGSFIAETTRVVFKLLESHLTVECILAAPEWYEKHHEALSERPGVVYYQAPKSILQSIVGFKLHEGVMCRALVPKDAPLADFKGNPVIVLDGIAKAENVGAIVRNAGAFGVRHLLLGPNSCHPYNRRSVRVAMGNLFRMSVHQAKDLPEALAQLRQAGTRVYAFENRPFAQDLPGVSFNPSSALIIGSEGAGISAEVLAQADHFVRIPIDEHVYALNAACASAVGLYAFSRQYENSRA